MLGFYFLILLFVVFMARAVSSNEVPQPPIIDLTILQITKQGFYEGIIVCWRLVIVLMVGLAFIRTTRPSEIKGAVEWFLIPFPFIPHKRVATMMSLIMRFVPIIFDQARETVDAQRARCVENRRNPIYRMVKVSIPLFRRTFLCADKLAVAMEARCYNENRTSPDLFSTRRDWLALIVVICLCTLIVII